MYAYAYAYGYVYVYVHVYVYVNVYVYVYVHVHTHVICMYVCMYVGIKHAYSQVFKMFGWHRVGVMDGLFYTAGAKAFFLELIQRDLDAGTYDWTVLLDRTINTLADAESAADEVKVRDSRINMMVLPEFMGMWMMCQYYLRDMLPPDCWACTETLQGTVASFFYLVRRLIWCMPPRVLNL